MAAAVAVVHLPGGIVCCCHTSTIRILPGETLDLWVGRRQHFSVVYLLGSSSRSSAPASETSGSCGCRSGGSGWYMCAEAAASEGNAVVALWGGAAAPYYLGVDLVLHGQRARRPVR